MEKTPPAPCCSTFWKIYPSAQRKSCAIPGYADEGLIGSSDYQKERESELSILTDHEVMEFVRERNIGLIKFGDLQLAGIPLDEV